MGLEIAQLALSGGADDAGSTMMEENVVSASALLPTKPLDGIDNVDFFSEMRGGLYLGSPSLILLIQRH